MAEPIDVFFSYSHKDEVLRDALEAHLSVLKRQGLIRAWHDRRIAAGKEWQGEIDKQLESARVILLLVSVDFLASEYCYDIELTRAIERHHRGEARVIPIILRACDWHHTPFARLQALPRDAKPIVDWPSQDQAWTDVTRGIRAAIDELGARSHAPAATPPLKTGARPHDTSTTPSASGAGASPVFGDLAEVRAAYRRLHTHHRKLFNLLSHVRDKVAERHGGLPFAWWGPYQFTTPPREKVDPLNRWVFDFMPVANAYFRWASTKTPKGGSFSFQIHHSGDSAVDEDEKQDEPVPARFPPVASSKSTLDVYVRAVSNHKSPIDLVGWAHIDDLIEKTSGYKEAHWFDGEIHDADVGGVTVRFGGFKLDMAELKTSKDINKRLLDPLIALIAAAQAS